MSEYKTPNRVNLKIKAFEITQHTAVNPEQARKVIEEAIRKIPDSELTNFRAGHVLIIK